MLVSEILRIKGNALFITPPHGTVLDAVNVMAQHDIGSLVVMDHGHMVGMLTFSEVLQALAKQKGQLGDLKVSDIQVSDPLTATTGLDVMELRAKARRLKMESSLDIVMVDTASLGEKAPTLHDFVAWRDALRWMPVEEVRQDVLYAFRASGEDWRTAAAAWTARAGPSNAAKKPSPAVSSSRP